MSYFDVAGVTPQPLALALCAIGLVAASVLFHRSHKQAKRLQDLRQIAQQTLADNPDSQLEDVDELLAKFPAYKTDHVFHDVLNHEQGVLCPYVRYNAEASSMQAVVRYGERTRGHPDLVHGGISALTFDNCLGWLLFMSGKANVLTAYLHVDFKAPLLTTTTALVSVKVDKEEGRKLYLIGSLTSLDGSVTYSVCNSLFVIPKDQTRFEKTP